MVVNLNLIAISILTQCHVSQSQTPLIKAMHSSLLIVSIEALLKNIYSFFFLGF